MTDNKETTTTLKLYILVNFESVSIKSFVWKWTGIWDCNDSSPEIKIHKFENWTKKIEINRPKLRWNFTHFGNEK